MDCSGCNLTMGSNAHRLEGGNLQTCQTLKNDAREAHVGFAFSHSVDVLFDVP